MLVFEGYSGKSIAVGRYLESLNDNVDTLIVDGELGHIQFADPTKLSYNLYSLKMRNTDGDLIKNLNKEGMFEKFKRVVLYINTQKKHVQKYKELEEEFGVELILTVQTHDANLAPFEEPKEPRVVLQYEV
ncbi:hypothetical protein AB3N02_21785 [Priestia aryabhattai]|uniref:hypothetical protein n=1 Tax=Priestia aryabhattai TaxID=412384 RepID=UPI0039A0FD03